MAVTALLGLGVRIASEPVAGQVLTARLQLPPASAAPTPDPAPAPTPAAAPVRSEPTPTPTTEEAAPRTRKTAKKAKADAKPRVPATGPGTYVGAKVSRRPGSSRGALRRFDVRVEKGLDIDPDQAARLMESVLNDERSWAGTGRWRFQLVPTGRPVDLHAYLATPGTTDRLCAPLRTRGEVSCQNGRRVVLNAKRWTSGVKYYGDDVAGYRRYLVNHEFGHALGHDHVRCPGRGRSAPVMMQQTKGLGGCRKNPWPRKTG